MKVSHAKPIKNVECLDYRALSGLRLVFDKKLNVSTKPIKVSQIKPIALNYRFNLGQRL